MIDADVYGNAVHVGLSERDEHHLPFCAGRNGAKVACVNKARNRLKVCVICGSKMSYHWPTRVVCNSCEDAHYYGVKALERDRGERVTLELGAHKMGDRSEWPWDRSSLPEEVELAKTLARAVDPDADTSYSTARVTVRKGQREAIEELMAVFGKALMAARASGHREGSSILRGLASGKLTADELNDITAKRERVK